MSLQQVLKVGLSDADKKAMAVDITNKVHERFQGIKTISSETELATLPEDERAFLYYVTDIAHFAFWNGSAWEVGPEAFGEALNKAIANKTSDIRFYYDAEGYLCYEDIIGG